MTRLTLIVAATLTNGIGQNSRLPWRLPQEMAYFARATTNASDDTVNAVVMGRNTWESIPERFRPLKERLNIVITRNKDYQLMPEGSPATDTPPLLSTSLESTLMRLSDTEHEGRLIHRSFIIGGASLYYDTLKLAPTGPSFVDRILLTRIISPAFEDCDVFMPNFERVGELQGHPWRRVGHNELEDWVGFKVAEGIQEEKGVKYEFQMWVR